MSRQVGKQAYDSHPYIYLFLFLLITTRQVCLFFSRAFGDELGNLFRSMGLLVGMIQDVDKPFAPLQPWKMQFVAVDPLQMELLVLTHHRK